MSAKPKTPKAPARRASAPKPDPIFALIAEHQAAIDLLDTVWKLTGGDDAPGYTAAEDIEGKTFKRLINKKPKTLAGLAAFADSIWQCDKAQRQASSTDSSRLLR